MSVERLEQGVLVVRPAGNEPALSAALDEAEALVDKAGDADGAVPHIVLDLSAVTYANSITLAHLLQLRKHAVLHESRLVLCHVAPQVMGVFQVTGLDRVFACELDRAAALTAVGAAQR